MRRSPSPLKSRTRYALTQAGDNLQLAVLKRVISVNRSLARARRWLAPVDGWLWILPLMLLVGFAGGYLSQLR